MKEEKVKSKRSGCENVAPGVWRLRILFVNVYLVAANEEEWVLVDAGLKGSSDKIMKAAAAIFGNDRPPAAIVLTHGHFDHIGALKPLLQVWRVPVYAHPMEMPYLTGISAYPPPDPVAGGGMMSWMSFLYPNEPIDLGDQIQPLTKDGSLPFLQQWRYVHTPGHSPGHISLFRDLDRLLLSGDAFITTRQESVISVMLQSKHLSGPPKYFTYDWEAAAASVKRLRELEPLIAASGHGRVVRSEELIRGLDHLIDRFERIAVPRAGRYTQEPARVNKKGVTYLPRRKRTSVLVPVAMMAVFAALAVVVINRSKSGAE